MQRNTDPVAQAKRRRDAWQSAVISSGLLLLGGAVPLVLRQLYVPEGFWGAVLLLLGLLELGMILPVWILLKTRLKEIEGGEEDAAAKY